MDFNSPFDQQLAERGPACIFLPDREGMLRFDAEWSRDAWGRYPGPHVRAFTWTLLRDRDTGFVMIALVTSPTLLPDHPRMEVRAFESVEEAQAARASFGAPPLSPAPW